MAKSCSKSSAQDSDRGQGKLPPGWTDWPALGAVARLHPAPQAPAPDVPPAGPASEMGLTGALPFILPAAATSSERAR